MGLLAFVFVSIVLLAFAAVMVVLRPTKTDKAIEKRITKIRQSPALHPDFHDNAIQLLKSDSPTRFKWFEALLSKTKVSQSLQARMDQAQVRVSVGAFLLISAALGAGAFLLAFQFLPFLPVAVAAAGLSSCIPLGAVSIKQSRRVTAFNAALPDAIDLMGRALRAGHSMQAAIGMVSEQCVEPVSAEFADVFHQQNFGLPLREALVHLLDRVPSQDLRVLVTAILVQRDTGGNLAEILDRTANVIRERLRIKQEIRIHTAQGRLTGWILSFLPASMFVLINLVNPGYSHVLLVDPLGQKLLYVGIGLTMLGALVIRHIVNGIDI